MTPESINLYLAANGVTVTGNTDQYYRLSPNGIKAWYTEVSQPTETDLIPYEQQVIDSENNKPKIYSNRQFFELFTKAEAKSIRQKSKSDDEVAYWMDLLMVSPTVNTGDQNTIDGINYLVSVNVITQARADEILG